MTVQPLNYQSGSDPFPFRRKWLGVSSCAGCGVAVVAAGVCLIGMTQATGWDKLGWFLGALICSWIGCAAGLIFALCGLFPRRKRHRFALAGLVLNLVVGLGPITAIWIASFF